MDDDGVYEGGENEVSILLIVGIFVSGMALLTAVAFWCCGPHMQAFFRRIGGPRDVSKVFAHALLSEPKVSKK